MKTKKVQLHCAVMKILILTSNSTSFQGSNDSNNIIKALERIFAEWGGRKEGRKSGKLSHFQTMSDLRKLLKNIVERHGVILTGLF
jgi:hypothetical protein